MTTSVLTPLQLIAGASLLQNQGIGVATTFTNAVSAYTNSTTISPLVSAVSTASAANVSANTINAMTSAGSNTCPALNDSLPTAYGSLGSMMTLVLTTQATNDAGSNNVSKFCQAIAISEGYGSQTNLFVNSAVNSQTYLNNSFTSMNNTITGDITQVNLATGSFATDLAALGRAIDLANLNDLGSPALLLKQIYKVTGSGIPSVALALNTVGVPIDVVLDLSNPNLSVTDSIQKLMYTAMTQITGSTLDQVLKVLNVTTVGILTMADLLNPAKMFPNSFQSLTVPTINGTTPIYIDSTASVNTQLTRLLPPYVVSSLV
jgi:hypothetical protein